MLHFSSCLSSSICNPTRTLNEKLNNLRTTKHLFMIDFEKQGPEQNTSDFERPIEIMAGYD
jgi:hypothetical protein